MTRRSTIRMMLIEVGRLIRRAWSAAVLLIASGAVCHAEPLQLKYLGAAGWELKSGELIVLVDPYISRIKYDDGGDPNDGRKQFADTDPLTPDTALIDSIITRADYILVHHGHPDHIHDVPYIARKTGARVIGTESSINILRAYDIPESQLYPVQGGEDYQFEGFSVRVVPSLHSALGGKHYIDSRRHGEDLRAPLRLNQMIEGGSLMFLARFAGQQVLTMGSMNFIEREMEGLKPDILLAGAGSSRTEIYKYTERLLTLTGFPKVVIPSHWDNFLVTYKDEAALQKAWKEKGEPFVQEARAASPGSRLIRPKHLEPIVIAPSNDTQKNNRSGAQ